MADVAQRRAWAAAFARQAVSDLECCQALYAAKMPACQLLHYLQMAAEKVCKACLHSAGLEVGRTHAVIKKHLPVLVRGAEPGTGRSKAKIARLKEPAQCIELLAPALDAGGTRPDNAEYPWPDLQGNPVSPLDFAFDVFQNERELVTLTKIISRAAQAYLTAADQ